MVKIYLLLCLLCAATTRAATLTAASASSSAVQTSINAASNGDTVQVPAGSASWGAGAVAITKGVRLKGATAWTAGTTTITLTGHAAIRVAPGAGQYAEVNGFSFVDADNSSTSTDTPFRVVTGTATAVVRVCSNIVTNCKQFMSIYDDSAAACILIDRNTASISGNSFVDVFGADKAAWDTAAAFGTTNMTYIEHNVLIASGLGDGVMDCYGGSKFVFRYNIVTNGYWGWHGCDSGNNDSGIGWSPHSYEIYGNQTYYNNGGYYCVFNSRGGTGLFFSNSVSGRTAPGSAIYMQYYRQSQPSQAGTWGVMNGSNPFDGNIGSPAGYPGICQQGRTGPTTGYGKTGSGSSTTQVLSPTYIWNNDANHSIGTDASTIQLNRDYYLSAKPGYSPLADPHPLAGGADTNIPAMTQLNATFTNGFSASYQVAGLHNPTTFGVTNLNTGLSLNTSSGLITGTPTVTQTGPGRTVGLFGTNAYGIGWTSVVFSVEAPDASLPQAVVANQTGVQGTPFTYTPTYYHSPTGFATTNLNAGLTVSATTGAFSGTPTTAVVSQPVGLYMTNVNGTSWTNFTITINAASAGNNYYVATTGSDAANGAIGTPWRTLEYATAHMAAGDTLYVRGGTYTEVFDLYGPTGINDVYPTRVRNYPGETPVFNGGSIASGGNSLNQLGFYWLEGLTITNYQTALYVGYDGACSNLVITNMTIRNVGNQGLQVYNQSHDVLVVKNFIDHTGLGSQNGEGIYVGNNTSPSDNTHDVIIRGNLIHDTKDEGIEIKPGSHHTICESNTLYTINKAQDSYGAGGGAIEVDEMDVSSYGSDPEHIVRGNLIYDTVIGIHQANGSFSYNNVIYGCSQNGILIDTANGDADSYYRRAYNNTVDGPSTAASIQRTAGTYSILNNIGPNSANNVAINSAFFVNRAAHNYHLVVGATPIDSGNNLLTFLADDFDGNTRPLGTAMDMGAYEYIPLAAPGGVWSVNVLIKQ